MKSAFLFAAVCLLTAAAPFLDIGPGRSVLREQDFPGWPSTWEGLPLRQLPLSAREKHFQEGFPGEIGRFTDGRRQFVIRWVTRTTRKLHPASDCFRGAGYSVRPAAIRVKEQRRWGCFEASRGSEQVEVCELIFDESGKAWPDVSSWYWAAVLGQSQGPWWTVAMVAPSRWWP